LQADFAHDFKAAGGEALAQFFQGDALPRRHPVGEGCARNNPSGCGVLPFLHAFGIAKNNCGDVETLHLGEHILHVFAGGRWIQRRGAWFLDPAGGIFLPFRIGRSEFRSVRAHGGNAGEGCVHRVGVDIEHRREFRDVGVLGGTDCRSEGEENGETYEHLACILFRNLGEHGESP
jgi:hypothetical protein